MEQNILRRNSIRIILKNVHKNLVNRMQYNPSPNKIWKNKSQRVSTGNDPGIMAPLPRAPEEYLGLEGPLAWSLPNPRAPLAPIQHHTTAPHPVVMATEDWGKHWPIVVATVQFPWLHKHKNTCCRMAAILFVRSFCFFPIQLTLSLRTNISPLIQLILS